MAIIEAKGINKLIQQNDELEPTNGWFTTDEQLGRNYVTKSNNEPEETDRFIKEHLPMAAKKAETLIDEIKKHLNIGVPESYLRVRQDGVYHVLLMVSLEDFVSPKIAAARVLANEIARRTRTYDISFTFSVQSGTVINKVVQRSYYTLKHIQQHFDN